LPAWLQSAQQSQLAGVQGMPTYKPYTGELAAGLTPAQLQAITSALQNNGSGQPNFAAATGAAGGVIGANAPQLSAGGINANTQAFMNPFIGNVVDTTNQYLDQQRAKELQSNNLTAASVGALGGDRAGVQDALTNYYGDMTKGATDASILNSGFQNAQNTAVGMGNTNVNSMLQKLGLNLSGAGAITAAGTAGTNANYTDLSGLLTAGGVAQNTNQLGDTLHLGEYQNAYNSLLQKYGLINQTMSGITPSNTGQNSTTQSNVYSSPLGTLAGLGLGIAGIAGGPMGSAIGKGLGNLFMPSFNPGGNNGGQ
jgi:hypothetical protein